ncbi:MAG: TRAFs-binding domain-containing protein [Alphaproteobacteria bacterium]
MNLQPLCFVIMPYGDKPDPAGGNEIDFDRIYRMAIAPAIEAANMVPIRSDEERTGGIIHKPMFERLLLCNFAIADLTTANANVFYELGVRHAARPATTLTIFAKRQPIPFDVNFLRSLPYDLGENNAFGRKQAKALCEALTVKLNELRRMTAETPAVDSPLFQLLGEWQPGDIARLKTDVFREQVQLNEQLKRRLAAVREKGKDKACRTEATEDLRSLQGELGDLDTVEVATAIDLMLSHRALENWDGMIGVYKGMPEALKRQVMVREQLAFALNRRAGKNKAPDDRQKALRILTEVEREQGASSETCGLIGRIHKDNWTDALEKQDQTAAKGHLKKAIDAYVRGFMADLRDAYPGINAVTLLDIKGDPDALRQKDRLLPVVRFAVERRVEGAEPDYWDHATMLELAVLDNEPDDADEHLADAAAAIRETWEPASTANNLRMIERARAARGVDTSWLSEIIAKLVAKAA